MKNSIREVASIVQNVAMADSPENQVNLIVESISKSMQVDVCSLYLVNDNNEMELLATRGLAAVSVRNIRIPAGKGLVGLAAASRHPVNIADAEQHPAYYYVAETAEERFHGFCAVPLVSTGKVLGVLVVQSSQQRQFSPDEESFLVTLAAQLAMLFTDFQRQATVNPRSALTITGIRGAPGIGIGISHLCSHNDIYNIADQPCKDIPAAISEWHLLLETATAQLDSEQKTLASETGDQLSSIFNVYRLILADPSYTRYVEEVIRAGHGVPGAIRQATQHFSEIFLNMEDRYLQTRHEDIHQLGNKLLATWTGLFRQPLPITQDVILIGKQITVSDMASVPAQFLKGVISTDGSALSHVAVLANAMGIPAIIGVSSLQSIAEGQLIIMDGEQAQIHLEPSARVEREYRKLICNCEELERELEKLSQKPAITTDGHEITLYTNTGLLADISPGLKKGAQGVGLYRTEIPFMVHDSFPTEEEQTSVYRQVLQLYEEKPVYMRTLDVGGDKQLPYFPVSDEENPALGWRGIRFSLDNSQLLMTQIRAMLRASEGQKNLKILLPMVTSCSEVDDFIALLADACTQLHNEGYKIRQPPIGIMIEVPAAISQIAFWAGKIDFLSIGSNDLSQYLLAIDRNNARVASKYDHTHPAVLHEIKRIIRYAKLTDIPLSLCGEMATDPIAVILLIGLGLKTLSMSAVKLPYMKSLIRNISLADAQKIANHAMLLDSPKKIRAHVLQELEKLGLAEILNQYKNVC